jgi:hypothetical protein
LRATQLDHSCLPDHLWQIPRAAASAPQEAYALFAEAAHLATTGHPGLLPSWPALSRPLAANTHGAERSRRHSHSRAAQEATASDSSAEVQPWDRAGEHQPQFPHLDTGSAEMTHESGTGAGLARGGGSSRGYQLHIVCN